MTVRKSVQCEAVKTPSPADYKKLNDEFERQRQDVWKRRKEGENVEYPNFTVFRRDYILQCPRCSEEATTLIADHSSSEPNAFRCVCDKHHYPRRSVVAWKQEDHPAIHELPEELYQQVLAWHTNALENAEQTIISARKRIEIARQNIAHLEQLRQSSDD